MKVFYGMQSAQVGELQDLLKSNGFQAGPTDGYFEEMTLLALQQFQASANQPVDQHTTAETFDALRRFVKTTDKANKLRKEISLSIDIPACDPVTHAILSCAKSQLHIEEFPIGTNRGVTVDKYTHRWGIPWSACFVSWCLNNAKWHKGEQKPVLGTYVYSPQDWKQKLIQEQRWMVGIRTIQPGDVWIISTPWMEGQPGIPLHMGWCLQVLEEEKEILTLEGNSANGVRCLKRSRESLCGWGRPAPMPV